MITHRLDAEQRARFDEARSAGLSAIRAARWVRYLAMKAERGEQPITLEQAVAQPVTR